MDFLHDLLHSVGLLSFSKLSHRGELISNPPMFYHFTICYTFKLHLMNLNFLACRSNAKKITRMCSSHGDVNCDVIVRNYHFINEIPQIWETCSHCRNNGLKAIWTWFGFFKTRVVINVFW